MNESSTKERWLETEDGWIPIDETVELIVPRTGWSPAAKRIALAWSGFVSGLMYGLSTMPPLT